MVLFKLLGFYTKNLGLDFLTQHMLRVSTQYKYSRFSQPFQSMCL